MSGPVPRAPAEAALPAVRDGDLVFQVSQSEQSALIAAVTQSRWTHVGVVLTQDGAPWVLEAVQPVRMTRLDEWIRRGADEEVVVKRLADADEVLTAEVIGAMRGLAAGWLGRDYDLRFAWSDDALYCSELVRKLYERAAGVKLGRLERMGDMRLDDPRVQDEIRRRFGSSFTKDEPIVTPRSLFEDPALLTVNGR